MWENNYVKWDCLLYTWTATYVNATISNGASTDPEYVHNYLHKSSAHLPLKLVFPSRQVKGKGKGLHLELPEISHYCVKLNFHLEKSLLPCKAIGQKQNHQAFQIYLKQYFYGF